MSKTAPKALWNQEMKFPSVGFKSLNASIAKSLGSSKVSDLVIVVSTKDRVKSKQFLKAFPSLRTRTLSGLSRLPESPDAGVQLSFGGASKEDADLNLAILPEDPSTFALLGFAKTVIKSSLLYHHKSFALIVDEPKLEASLYNCFGSALAARLFQLPSVGKRTEKIKTYKLENILSVAGKAAEKNFNEGFVLGNGSNMVRFLGLLPPNVLTPGDYGKRIRDLAKQFGFEYRFYSNVELKKMGAGSFTAVDQGDPKSEGGIYEITYSPRSAKNKKPIALVGKGLCFDTGGYDVKTNSSMITMKGDMQGSALALTNLVVAAQMKLPLKLKAFLGITANHISPVAYTADEVVVAMNGVSIEVINTDAEGRMVLADTLCLAGKSNPEMIMDFATLTGSAVRSLGTRYAAGFTNEEKLHSEIVRSGRESGERVWTFPLDNDYGKILESQIADTLQCARGPGPDHIHAAFFLKKFVDPKVRWVHIDLAAAENEGGLAHTDTLFTGYGVRFSIEFLRRQYKV